MEIKINGVGNVFLFCVERLTEPVPHQDHRMACSAKLNIDSYKGTKALSKLRKTDRRRFFVGRAESGEHPNTVSTQHPFLVSKIVDLLSHLLSGL